MIDICVIRFQHFFLKAFLPLAFLRDYWISSLQQVSRNVSLKTRLSALQLGKLPTGVNRVYEENNSISCTLLKR